MMPGRLPTVTALAATAVLALGAPDARAQAVPVGGAGCVIVGFDGSAGTAGTGASQCGTLNFVGPAIGQIASVIGPTIISPAVTGTVLVTGNNVGAVP